MIYFVIMSDDGRYSMHCIAQHAG